jgi:ribosomal protein L28
MAVCTICQKGKLSGRNIRHKHSGLWERKAPASTRVFEANIQKRKVLVSGISVQVELCTKCIKKIRNEPGWKGLRLFTPTAHETNARVELS